MDTDEDVLRLADQASALKANPAWTMALDRIETDLVDTWKRSSPHEEDRSTRESCHRLIRAVSLLRCILEEYIQTGVLKRQTDEWLTENPNESL